MDVFKDKLKEVWEDNEWIVDIAITTTAIVLAGKVFRALNRSTRN